MSAGRTTPDVAATKQRLRKAIRALLAQVSETEKASARRAVSEVLLHSGILAPQMRILAFYPHRNEIDIRLFLKTWLLGRRELFLPRVAPVGDLEVWRLPGLLAVRPGYLGIPEPDAHLCALGDPLCIDAVITPGLAFNRNGARLGQGKGFFDRLLHRLRPDALRIGVAYDWQVLDGQGDDAVPMESHDEWMNYLATPRGLIDCREIANDHKGR